MPCTQGETRAGGEGGCGCTALLLCASQKKKKSQSSLRVIKLINELRVRLDEILRERKERERKRERLTPLQLGKLFESLQSCASSALRKVYELEWKPMLSTS